MQHFKALFFIYPILTFLGLKDIHAQDFWVPINPPDSCRILNVRINTSGDIFLGLMENYSTPNYKGVQRSSDHGGTWIPICPTSYGYAYIAFDQSEQLYAVTFDSIFKSQNNGDSWEFLYRPAGICSVLECGFDSIVLKGGYDYTAIVRSGDHGNTWKVALELQGLWPWVTGFAFANNGIIYASVRVTDAGASGVYRSTDFGNSWEPFGMTNYAVYSIAMDNNDNVLAGTLGQGLFRYDISSEQWSNLIDSTSINGIFVSPDNKFYLASSDMPTFNNRGGCIIYNDSTGTWYNKNSGLMDHFNSDGIRVDEEGYLLLWAGSLLFKSSEQVITAIGEKKDVKEQNKLSCSPSPCNDYTTLSYGEGNHLASGINIRVFGPEGKIYFQSSGTTIFPFRINMKDYPPGLYSVVINDNGSIRILKIIHR